MFPPYLPHLSWVTLKATLLLPLDPRHLQPPKVGLFGGRDEGSSLPFEQKALTTFRHLAAAFIGNPTHNSFDLFCTLGAASYSQWPQIRSVLRLELAYHHMPGTDAGQPLQDLANVCAHMVAACAVHATVAVLTIQAPEPCQIVFHHGGDVVEAEGPLRISRWPIAESRAA